MKIIGFLLIIVISGIIIFFLRWPKAIDSKNYKGFKRKWNKIDINKIRTLI